MRVKTHEHVRDDQAYEIGLSPGENLSDFVFFVMELFERHGNLLPVLGGQIIGLIKIAGDRSF